MGVTPPTPPRSGVNWGRLSPRLSLDFLSRESATLMFEVCLIPASDTRVITDCMLIWQHLCDIDSRNLPQTKAGDSKYRVKKIDQDNWSNEPISQIYDNVLSLRIWNSAQIRQDFYVNWLLLHIRYHSSKPNSITEIDDVMLKHKCLAVLGRYLYKMVKYMIKGGRWGIVIKKPTGMSTSHVKVIGFMS